MESGKKKQVPRHVLAFGYGRLGMTEQKQVSRAMQPRSE
jgi:hypothetical protein